MPLGPIIEFKAFPTLKLYNYKSLVPPGSSICTWQELQEVNNRLVNNLPAYPLEQYYNGQDTKKNLPINLFFANHPLYLPTRAIKFNFTVFIDIESLVYINRQYIYIRPYARLLLEVLSAAPDIEIILQTGRSLYESQKIIKILCYYGNIIDGCIYNCAVQKTSSYDHTRVNNFYLISSVVPSVVLQSKMFYVNNFYPAKPEVFIDKSLYNAMNLIVLSALSNKTDQISYKSVMSIIQIIHTFSYLGINPSNSLNQNLGGYFMPKDKITEAIEHHHELLKIAKAKLTASRGLLTLPEAFHKAMPVEDILDSLAEVPEKKYLYGLDFLEQPCLEAYKYQSIPTIDRSDFVDDPRKLRILPNQYTVVLDLDETLVHCTRDLENIYIRRGTRFLLDFLSVSNIRVIIWTAGSFSHASSVLSLLDPDGTLVNGVIYRNDAAWNVFSKNCRDIPGWKEHCCFIDNTYAHCAVNKFQAIKIDDFIPSDYADFRFVEDISLIKILNTILRAVSICTQINRMDLFAISLSTSIFVSFNGINKNIIEAIRDNIAGDCVKQYLILEPDAYKFRIKAALNNSRHSLHGNIMDLPEFIGLVRTSVSIPIPIPIPADVPSTPGTVASSVDFSVPPSTPGSPGFPDLSDGAYYSDSVFEVYTLPPPSPPVPIVEKKEERHVKDPIFTLMHRPLRSWSFLQPKSFEESFNDEEELYEKEGVTNDGSGVVDLLDTAGYSEYVALGAPGIPETHEESEVPKLSEVSKLLEPIPVLRAGRSASI